MHMAWSALIVWRINTSTRQHVVFRSEFCIIREALFVQQKLFWSGDMYGLIVFWRCAPALFLCFYAQVRRRSRVNLPAVAAGDRVVAKHRNGRYYRAVVLSVSDVVYYKVAFDDGTYSNDMYPEDIEASNINPRCM